MVRTSVLVLALTLAIGCGSKSGGGGGFASIVPPTPAPPQPSVVPAVAVPTSAVATNGAKTRYPIVLVHGALGYRTIGSHEYFVGVAGMLRSRGNDVLVTQTSPVNSIAHRARELTDQILAAYPTGKVNLICHSMGGVDSREAICRLGMGPRVASLTTISTPHRGIVIFDATNQWTPLNAQQIVDNALGKVGMSWDMMKDLSMAFMNGTFNPTTPDDPGVFYQSWGGLADPWGHTGTRLTPVMWASWFMVSANQGDCDGMVAVDSAKWGLWRGTIPADHLGEIGSGSTKFAHLPFYESIARDLAARGY